MTVPGYALFDTPIGRCGVAWNARGLSGVQLPQPFERQTRMLLVQRSGDEPSEMPAPPEVAAAIAAMTALLCGDKRDLAGIALDMSRIDDFPRAVYEIARTIPAGRTLTYGDIAKRIGGVELSRDVGQALGRNPFPIVVPCHRVLAAGDRPGGFSANGGVRTKLKLLAIEGAYVNYTPSLFDDGDDA
jgi:methylated-DNA-[protein]-cysteine S-methyltransferase